MSLLQHLDVLCYAVIFTALPALYVAIPALAAVACIAKAIEFAFVLFCSEE